MKTMIQILVLVAVQVGFVQMATCKTKQEVRASNLKKKLSQGRTNGQLSEAEAAKLHKLQRQEFAVLKKSLKDGKLSKVEKRKINSLQKRLGRELKIQTTDKEKASRDERRQLAQRKLIKAGQRKGSINSDETRLLKSAQAKIDRAQKIAKADGKLSKAEKAKLAKLQSKQDKQILKQSKDADFAFRNPYAPYGFVTNARQPTSNSILGTK